MKMTVHNLDEVNALIKEEIRRGDSEKFNGCVWYDHCGRYLCRSFCGLANMFHLELPNVTVESFEA